MNTATMPIPGALRLRRIHPLIDGDGSCSLIYDVERAAVLDVPVELQFHIAPALETGDLDEDLLSWLVNEDLVTADRLGGYGEAVEEAAGLEAGVWWSLGSVHRGVRERQSEPCETGQARRVGDLPVGNREVLVGAAGFDPMLPRGERDPD